MGEMEVKPMFGDFCAATSTTAYSPSSKIFAFWAKTDADKNSGMSLKSRVAFSRASAGPGLKSSL